MKRVLVLALVLGAVTTAAVRAAEGAAIVHRNLSYGPDPAQKLDVWAPDTGSNLPAILLVHGGAWDNEDKTKFDGVAGIWAGRGFVVFNINYRLAAPKPWIAEEQDVYFAFQWARTNAATYNADPTRFGMFGFSAGGHLAMVEAFTRPENVKAVAEWSAVWDMVQLVTEQGCPTSPCAPAIIGSPQYASAKAHKFLGWSHLNGSYNSPETGQPPISNCAPDCRPRYINFSPSGHVAADSPPTFIAHHTNDAACPVSQARTLRDKLTELGVPVEYHEKLGTIERHTFYQDAEIIDLTADFFEARL